MNRQQLDQLWDHMRQVNGIAMRCVAALPADKLDSQPIAKMRTPKELVVHMYGMCIDNIANSLIKGSVEEIDEKPIVTSIKSKDDLLKYCRASWDSADKAARAVTDAQLQSLVKTPWGSDFPGFVMAEIIRDEFIHHRGQLYTYVRAFGVEPPMMWDFEHNDAGFQPKAKATA